MSSDGDKIVTKMCQGLASWFTWSQVLELSKAFNETALYLPIYQMAIAQKWEIHPQFPLPKGTKRKGPPQTLDFLMVNKEKSATVGIELKFIKSEKNYDQDVPYDLGKLAKVSNFNSVQVREETIDNQNYSGYFIFVARGYSIFNNIKRRYNNDKFRDLFDQTKNVWGDKNNDPRRSADNPSGILEKAIGGNNRRFAVMALKQQGWWENHYRVSRKK